MSRAKNGAECKAPQGSQSKIMKTQSALASSKVKTWEAREASSLGTEDEAQWEALCFPAFASGSCSQPGAVATFCNLLCHAKTVTCTKSHSKYARVMLTWDLSPKFTLGPWYRSSRRFASAKNQKSEQICDDVLTPVLMNHPRIWAAPVFRPLDVLLYTYI